MFKNWGLRIIDDDNKIIGDEPIEEEAKELSADIIQAIKNKEVNTGIDVSENMSTCKEYGQ